MTKLFSIFKEAPVKLKEQKKKQSKIKKKESKNCKKKIERKETLSTIVILNSVLLPFIKKKIESIENR